MRLTDLSPAFDAIDQSISFHCPFCRLGVVSVGLVEGEPEGDRHGCNKLPPDFATLTITPSVADEGRCSRTNRGCAGWHGFIINGNIEGGV